MDFMVIGLDIMNQNHIFSQAHDGKIVQIITLSKFDSKYFATRCQYGDFGIWGSNKHPDRVLRIQNMDDPDYPQGQEEKVVEKVAPKKKDSDDEEEEEELDDDGNPIKKAPEVVVVKKDFSNRVSSVKDQMIEIKWTLTLIQSSATVLVVSNYNESFVYITSIDLKMRRQTQLHRYHTSNKPTKLYPIDTENLLIGTEGGKIEHWVYAEKACKKIYEAHPESDAGISAIIELKTQNELLRGSSGDDSFRLIATASDGAS